MLAKGAFFNFLLLAAGAVLGRADHPERKDHPYDMVSLTVHCKPNNGGECLQQIKHYLHKVDFHVDKMLHGTDFFAFHMPQNKVGGLRKLELVLEAHENEARFMLEDVPIERDEGDESGHQRHLRENPSFNVDYVNARGVWNLPGGRGTRGAGVKVCVVEAGIADGHPDLDYSKIIAEPEMLFTGAKSEHGTRVTGVIAAQPYNDQGVLGIAPDAEIIGVKWGSDGDPNSSDVIAALLECRDKGADIVTFSVGGFQPSQEEEDFCQEIVDGGIVLVGASGNFHNDPNYAGHKYYPSSYDSFLTVGSINWSGSVSRFSSRGPQLDLVAPAEWIRTISAEKKSISVLTSGTSFSSPLVAGALALLKSLKPSATPAELRQAVIETATRPTAWPASRQRDDAYGHGTLNVLKAAEYLLGNQSNTVPAVVHVNLDNWPRDVSFNVFDDSGTIVMKAGPFPSDSTRIGKMKQSHHEWNLVKGCYEFVIQDSDGDGICCGSGQGSYFIEYNGQRQIDTTFSTGEARHRFGDCDEEPVCGDGVIDANEECDDGNTADGDGCSSTCLAEVCGNGRVDANEECDDGNTQSGDGCSSTCLAEVCGNGRVDANEECDDGNTQSGDRCSATCLAEVCGNGRVDANEECDDGNTADGDGCSSVCLAEVCGNGRVDANEECDDGNTADGDECTSECKIPREEGNPTPEVTVRVKTDRFGSETSWEIKDEGGNIVQSHSGFSSSATAEQTFDLASGCYEFTIKDSYGDGICCGSGIGNYTIIYDGATHVADFGFKGTSKTTKFGTCGERCPAMFSLEMYTDQYSRSENEIKVVNEDSGESIVDINTGLPVNSKFSMDTCVDPNQCYKLTITDTYGDGLLQGQHSSQALFASTAEFDGDNVLRLPFGDACFERCAYMGSCSDRPCAPSGCFRRRLRRQRKD